jgi:hypothetical protein
MCFHWPTLKEHDTEFGGAAFTIAAWSSEHKHRHCNHRSGMSS